MCIIKHQLHVITVIHTNVFMIFIIQPMLYTQEQVFFFWFLLWRNTCIRELTKHQYETFWLVYHDRNTMWLFQWLECVEHCLCQFYDHPPLDMCITLAIFFMVVSILDSVLSISCPNSSNMLNKLKQVYITYNNIYDQEQCVFLFVISFIPRNKMTAWLPLGCCWNKVH